MQHLAAKLLVIILLSIASPCYGLEMEIKDYNSITGLEITATNAAELTVGKSDDSTHIIRQSGVASTGFAVLNIETEGTRGFRLISACYSEALPATTGVPVIFQINRRVTVSTGGTVAVGEGTSATLGQAALDPALGTFSGIARSVTSGSFDGATIFQTASLVAELGTANFASYPPKCFDLTYGGRTKGIIVPAGLVNGVALKTGASGVGGLSAAAITATIVVE